VKCDECGKEVKTPEIYDRERFDGQVACSTCGMVYRLKMRGGQVKRFVPVEAFAYKVFAYQIGGR